MQAILTRYSKNSSDDELVFQMLCALLGESPGTVDWAGFKEADWKLLREIAVGEGVAAMAYHLLQGEPNAYQLGDFDPRTLQDFSEQEALLAVRNAVLFRQLDCILQELTGQGIPVVLLKGADLAYSLYPEPGLRSMSDLDLLVKESQFEQARAILNNIGYHEYLPEATPGLDKLLSHHAHLKKNGTAGPLLELHWTLLGSPAFQHAAPMDWFWENLEPCPTWNSRLPAPNRVFRLNPTANLLYLAAHLMLQHGGEKVSLRWLQDIHRLIHLRTNEIDWQLLVIQAEKFGWGKAIHLALVVVQSCFQTPLPDGIMNTLQAQTGPHDRIVESKTDQSATRVLGEWKKLRSLNWRGRIKLISALILPGRAYVIWRYQPKPTWIWPIYYIYRWLDIARDGVRTFITILRAPSKHL